MMERVSKAERELVRKMQKQTNADKYFRNATDEEMARLIVDDWCELINCDYQIDHALHWNCEGSKCEEKVLAWLKQEVKDDPNEART